MDVNVITNLIATLGFPIVMVLLFIFGGYKIINRLMDENKSREANMKEMQDKTTETLVKITHTIEESDKINRELSETNRLLLEKYSAKLDDINLNVNKILDKMEG